MSFVPVLTTVLNCPAFECPNSGLNWFVSAENSCTASFGTVTKGPVTLLLLLSTPSIMKLLSRGRCPPTEGPVPAPTPPLVLTPDCNNDRFNTPRPWAAIGRSVVIFVSKVLSICALLVLIKGVAPDTSTVMDAAPTSRVTIRELVLFSSTAKFVIVVVVKFALLTRIV